MSGYGPDPWFLQGVLRNGAPLETGADYVDLAVAVAVFYLGLAALWLCVHTVLNNLWPRFASIEPAHKKWYIIANFSKCIMLALALCGPAFGHYPSWQVHWDLMLRDDWSGQTYIKRWAFYYVSTDIVALVLVPKLPTSTVVHHVVAGIMVAVLCLPDLEDRVSILPMIGRSVDLYGCLSSFPYLVNGFLALRVIYGVERPFMVAVRWIAAIVYALTCAVNFPLQIWHIYRQCQVVVPASGGGGGTGLTSSHLLLIPFAACLASLANDDIVLMRWLISPQRKKSKQQQQQQQQQQKQKKEIKKEE